MSLGSEKRTWADLFKNPPSNDKLISGVRSDGSQNKFIELSGKIYWGPNIERTRYNDNQQPGMPYQSDVRMHITWAELALMFIKDRKFISTVLKRRLFEHIRHEQSARDAEYASKRKKESQICADKRLREITMEIERIDDQIQLQECFIRMSERTVAEHQCAIKQEMIIMERTRDRLRQDQAERQTAVEHKRMVSDIVSNNPVVKMCDKIIHSSMEIMQKAKQNRKQLAITMTMTTITRLNLNESGQRATPVAACKPMVPPCDTFTWVGVKKPSLWRGSVTKPRKHKTNKRNKPKRYFKHATEADTDDLCASCDKYHDYCSCCYYHDDLPELELVLPWEFEDVDDF